MYCLFTRKHIFFCKQPSLIQLFYYTNQQTKIYPKINADICDSYIPERNNFSKPQNV